MKPIFLAASLSRSGGGLFSALPSLAQAMRAQGAFPMALGLQDRHFQADLGAWRGLEARTYPVLGPAGFGYAPKLGKALPTFQADLLHLHGLWMYPSLLAARFPGPVVVSPHGMLDPWALKSSGMKKRLALALYERRNLARCACFHALSHSELESIRALGFRQPIALIPNGVFLPEPVAPESKDKTLLYVGRLHPKKNLAALLKAWKGLDRGAWKLRLVGWGEAAHAAELKALAGGSASVEGPLYGADKDLAFRQASGFVLPSLSEGLPMAALEAWAYGLPLLMSRHCNLGEGFAAGAALDSGTSEAEISRALKAFLGLGAHEARAMGLKGRELVENSFTWPLAASKMLAVYRWLLKQGPQPEWVAIA